MRIADRTIGVLLAASLAALAAPSAVRARGLEVGDTLTARTVETLAAGDLSLPADSGLTVLLFWATWSPRSAPALKMWQELYERYADRKMSVVTVNAEKQEYGADDRYQIEAYLSDNGITLPVYMDDHLTLFNEAGIIVLPTVLFLRGDGVITYKYAGFPTSAHEDIRADLEQKLGIVAVKPEEEAHRGKLAYQPKNNALLYYNLGQRLEEKGFLGKARPKYITALQKDPDYPDPLRALEGIYFAEGRTPDAEEALRAFLTENGLEDQVGRISEAGEAAPTPAVAGTASAVAATAQPAPAATPTDKPLTPMERMKLLMDRSKQGN